MKNISFVIQKIGARMRRKRAAGDGAERKGDFNHKQLSSSSCAKPWIALIARGVKIQLIFCEGGNAIDIYNLTLATYLSHYVKTGKLQSILVKDVDHTFTPIWSQNHLLDLTTSWLKKEFGENLPVVRHVHQLM